MSEAWGAVVAAIAAGVFGIIGILAGILVGRRQTTDQAAVEHGQWLRGQRQQAFADYLNAWDRAHRALEEIAANIDEHTRPENFHPQRFEEELAAHIAELLMAAIDPTQKPYEQLLLVIPEGLVPVAARTDNTLMGMMNRLDEWALCAPDAEVIGACIERYQQAVDRCAEAREGLFKAARSVLLSAPAPGGR